MLSHTDVYPYISTLQLTGTHWNTTFQAKLGLLIFRSFILFIIDSKQSLVLSHIGTGYHMGITKGYFTSSQEMQLGVAFFFHPLGWVSHACIFVLVHGPSSKAWVKHESHS